MSRGVRTQVDNGPEDKEKELKHRLQGRRGSTDL